jgi:NADH-quinone oxidoreductase subunit L
VVAVIGIVTALMAALAALFQTDIKKILAYSTISQLGLMVTAVGAGSWEAAFLHLITHAFFKACLFLCAGSVIHVLHQAQHQSHLHFDVQDIRNLGGLRKKLPFTFLAVLISGSALAGIPFFSGFISKEAIFTTLHHWKGDEFNARWMIFFLAFAVSFLTVMYITRFTVRIFFGKEGATSHLTLNEPPKIMRAPIGLLTLPSLWLAVSTNPFGGESYFIGSGAEHNTILTIFSAIWVLGALGVSWKIFSKPHELSSPVLRHSFYLDSLQNLLFVKPAMIFSNATMNIDRRLIDGAIHALAYAHVTVSHLAGWCDKTVIDGAVNGVASLSRLTGSLMRSFQGGKIQLYVFWAVFAIIIFLIWSLI